MKDKKKQRKKQQQQPTNIQNKVGALGVTLSCTCETLSSPTVVLHAAKRGLFRLFSPSADARHHSHTALSWPERVLQRRRRSGAVWGVWGFGGVGE